MTSTRSPDGRRLRAIVAGAVIVAAYVVVAVAPASLIGTAVRRPVLDGGGPAVPYNWVDPPEALASSNKEPSSVSQKVPLGPRGSQARTLSTSDVQITLIVAEQMIVPSAGATEALVKMAPLAPKKFPPAPPGLQLVGNVYRVQGTYLPSKKPLATFADPAKVLVIYPQLATIHASGGHQVLYSPNGKQWQALHTTDLVMLVQAEAAIPGPGYVAVAGIPGNTPTSATGTGGGINSRIAILVVLGCVALVGIGILIRLISKKE